jgi:uncharacterized protein DUF5666/uncharacterized protein DUF4382
LKNKIIARLGVGLSLALGTLLVMAGCGGGNNQTQMSATNPGSAAVMVGFGDAPLPGVLAFEVTVTNVTLTGPAGTVTVVNTPREIEVSHLAGTIMPLALINVPTGTYTQMSVTLSAAEILFLPAGGTTPIHLNVAAPSAPINITLNPPVSITGAPVSMKLDLNLASSLSVDAANNVTFTPTFSVVTTPVAAAGQQEDDDNGEADDLKGTFGGFTGTQFTLKVAGASQSLTINTNSSTVFDPSNLTLSTIPVGTVVEVDASTQADGTLLAKKVEVESENQVGMEAEGLVTTVTGNPATSFQLVTHEVTAPSANGPALGGTVTVTLGTNPTFRVDASGNLTIPAGLTFSATTLAPGQAVEADADLAGAITVSANRVQLKEEPVDGTIATVSGSNFQLTLDPNSALAKLSGISTVNVIASGAQNKTGATFAASQAVRVRGLLFFTPANGTTAASYTLVARQVRKP